jgi:hypothetical protein
MRCFSRLGDPRMRIYLFPAAPNETSEVSQKIKECDNV